MVISRRGFLKAVAGVAAAVTIPYTMSAVGGSNMNSAPSNLTRVNDQVSYVLDGVPGLKSCSYLIKDGKEGTLVDTGLFRDGGDITQLFREGNLSPSDIKRIFITHAHIDHARGLRHLKGLTGAKVYGQKCDFTRVDQKGGQQSWLAYLGTRDTNDLIDEEVGEGDEIPILGGAKVLNNPGHTPNDISLLLGNEGILFSGDALQYKHGKLCPPPSRWNVDDAEADKSYRRLRDMEGWDIACPGHYEHFVRKK